MFIKRINTFTSGVVLVAALFANPLWAGVSIEHWTTDSGARVFFVQSRELPMLDIQIDFVGGSAYDPAGLEGLASMTRGLLESGTIKLDEQAVAEAIADIGAQIGGSTDRDRSSFNLRTLSSEPEREAAIALAASLLSNPAFPEHALERERTRSLAGLRESLTRPATLSARAFSAAIYPDHPYGRASTEQSLASISRDDLVSFHKQYYVSANATITIVGDTDKAGAAAIADSLIRELPPGTSALPVTDPVMPQAATILIANPSVQAHIAVGMPGMSRDDPDYYPLLVGNHVLGGGGFTSRLTKEVRDARGYAYSVFSFFHPHRVAGPFQIGLQTRGAQSESALEVVNRVLTDFIANGPTQDELEAAQSNIINGFGLRLDSNRKILDHVAMIGFYGLPLDWLDSYPKLAAAVTAEQVQDAFARRIRPEHLITVVAGGDGDSVASSEAGN